MPKRQAENDGKSEQQETPKGVKLDPNLKSDRRAKTAALDMQDMFKQHKLIWEEDDKLRAWADAEYDKAEKYKSDHLGAKESLNTLAFGLYKLGVDWELAYARQDSKEWSLPDDFPIKITTKLQNVAPKSKLNNKGLHAEMMVVRWLLDQQVLSWKAGDTYGNTGLKLDGSIAKSAQAHALRIVCVGKLCCPNCAGWLKAHGIPHYPINAGKASMDWIHPRTGAAFHETQKEFGHAKWVGDKLVTSGAFNTIGKFTAKPPLLMNG